MTEEEIANLAEQAMKNIDVKANISFMIGGSALSAATNIKFDHEDILKSSAALAMICGAAYQKMGPQIKYLCDEASNDPLEMLMQITVIVQAYCDTIPMILKDDGLGLFIHVTKLHAALSNVIYDNQSNSLSELLDYFDPRN